MRAQQLSHAERRAELDTLVANYAGPIQRIETLLDVKCPHCFKQWKVAMTKLSNEPKIVCRSLWSPRSDHRAA